jgi:hypothetical protein
MNDASPLRQVLVFPSSCVPAVFLCHDEIKVKLKKYFIMNFI